MHSLTFQFKHAHLTAVAFGKKVVERVAHMTPARYDVMFSIRMNGVQSVKEVHPYGFVMAQDAIWKTLGLDHSTISILIKSLRELGWLTNHERAPHNRRTRLVRLTELGTRRIERAMRIVLQQHTHLKVFEAFFKRKGLTTHVCTQIFEFCEDVRDLARDLYRRRRSRSLGRAIPVGREGPSAWAEPIDVEDPAESPYHFKFEPVY